jgi:hypothetical protein
MSSITQNVYLEGVKSTLRSWFRPHDSIRELDTKQFTKLSQGKFCSSDSGESELRTRLASFSAAVRAHVEEAVAHNLDKGKLDLKTFDAKFSADLKIDGAEVGALEALIGNAAQRAEIEATNNRKRRAAFAFVETYSCKIYYLLTLTDQSFTQKIYDLLVAEWSANGLAEATAKVQSGLIWAKLVAAFQKRAALHQEQHLFIPLLEFILFSVNRPLWQQEHQGATSSSYIEELNTSLLVLDKGLGVKLPGPAVAEMAWGHLRTTERALLKTMTYVGQVDGKAANLPIKEDMKELRLALAMLDVGSPGEPYVERDSSFETRRLSQWLASPLGSKLLAWLNKLAGHKGHGPISPESPSRPPKVVPQPTKRSSKPDLVPKHKCGKCGKFGSHKESDCHGSTYRPGSNIATKTPQLAKPAPQLAKPAKSSRDAVGTDKKNPICYNCGKQGHSVPKCTAPLKRPFAFRPEVRAMEVKMRPNFSVAAVCALPRRKEEIMRHAAHPRDTYKVFIDVISAKADQINSVYSLLDTGASHTWISEKFASGYARLASPASTFETGGLPTTCLGWVRLPIFTGTRVVWLQAAVMPHSQLPQYCAALVGRFDLEELLQVDLTEVRRQYSQGKRLFACTYHDDKTPTVMAVEALPPGTDDVSSEDSVLQSGLFEHFAVGLLTGKADELDRPLGLQSQSVSRQSEVEGSGDYGPMNPLLLAHYGPDSPSYQVYKKKILENRRERSISRASKRSSKSSRFPYRRPRNVARSLQGH